jgi:hypothetical protein
VRRTSHGTISNPTNPGNPKVQTRSGRPVTTDPDDDDATVIDGPSLHDDGGSDELIDDLPGVPDFHRGKQKTSVEGPRVKTGVDGPRVKTGVDGPRGVRKAPSSYAKVPAPSSFSRSARAAQAAAASQPPATPSSVRRISATLVKIFQRRREAIGLSLSQVAKLSGIDEPDLKALEAQNATSRLLYDHAVTLARVLGVRPQDMPGLRPREAKDDLGSALGDLVRMLQSGPVIIFEGKAGERYGGDVDRIAATPGFCIKIGDASLGDAFPKGSLLAFSNEPPEPGDVTLVRHRRSKLLALRKLTPPSYSAIASWQPAYVVGGEWLAIGRLQVVLPRMP